MFYRDVLLMFWGLFRGARCHRAIVGMRGLRRKCNQHLVMVWRVVCLYLLFVFCLFLADSEHPLVEGQ